MSEPTSGTWPEQDAVWAWMERHGITLTMEQENDLKKAVTAPRISEMEAKEKAIEHADFMEDVKQTAEKRADKAVEALRSISHDFPGLVCAEIASTTLRELGEE